MASSPLELSSDNDNNLIIENELLDTTAVQELIGVASLTDDEDDVTGAVVSSATGHGRSGSSSETTVGSERTAAMVRSF